MPVIGHAAPAATIYRDYVTDGVPASGAKNPAKSDIRAYLLEVESGLGIPMPQGRLTLTSATPVLTADVTAATSIYYTPYRGDLVPIYDAANSRWTLKVFTELTLALDSNSGHTGYHQSAKNFDLFVISDAGTLRLVSGPAWTSDTGRGSGAGTTELARQNGILVNANAFTAARYGLNSGDTLAVAAKAATYLGSFRASANGRTAMVLKPAAAAGGGACTAYLDNAYNRVAHAAYSRDSTDSWTYTTATWRAANNNNANRISILRGLDEDAVDASYCVSSSNSTTTINRAASIGLDSTSSPAAAAGNSVMSGVTGWETHHARYVDRPGLGLHYLQALEWSAASGATTWYGDNGGGSPPAEQILQATLMA